MLCMLYCCISPLLFNTLELASLNAHITRRCYCCNIVKGIMFIHAIGTCTQLLRQPTAERSIVLPICTSLHICDMHIELSCSCSMVVHVTTQLELNNKRHLGHVSIPWYPFDARPVIWTATTLPRCHRRRKFTPKIPASRNICIRTNYHMPSLS